MKMPRTLSRPVSRRKLWCGLLLALLMPVWIAGCGGASAFTGGSFPIGRAHVFGRVADAENTDDTLANVQITLATTVAPGDTRTLQTRTDANGGFDFPNVPTGEFSAPVQVSVDPQDNQHRTQTVAFQVYNRRDASMSIALPSQAFDISRGRTLTITPSVGTLPPGSTLQYTARVYDLNGQVLPITPTLILSDALGTLGANGTFTGTTSGTSTLTAVWYNNLRATASIIVNPNANPLPPAPPSKEEITDRSSQTQTDGVEVGGTVKVSSDLHRIGNNGARRHP